MEDIASSVLQVRKIRFLRELEYYPKQHKLETKVGLEPIHPHESENLGDIQDGALSL